MFINKSTQVEESNIVISELDFGFDDFRRQKVFTNDNAYVQLIKRLLSTRKGTYPSIPDLGIGIQSYRFEDMDILMAGDLKNEIVRQINTYIPTIPLEDINIYKLPYNGDFVLYVDISFTSVKVKKVTFAYLQRNYAIISSKVTIEKQELIGQQDKLKERQTWVKREVLPMTKELPSRN